MGEVREWWGRCAQALGRLESEWGAKGPPASMDAREVQSAVVHLAPFLAYAAWTHPGLAQSASACLSLLEGGGSAPLPGASLVRAHAEGLLEWARACSTGGGWRDPGSTPLRYLIPWLIHRLPTGLLSGKVLGLALPLALRLCDDWEATSVWCGLSALWWILRECTPTALTPWGGVIQETLLRASTSTGATKHPTLAFLLGSARSAATVVFVGVSPPLPLPPLAKAVGLGGGKGYHGGMHPLPPPQPWGESAGGGDASHHGALFQGPWETALASLVRACTLSPVPYTLYAHLLLLPPILLSGGPLVVGPTLSSTLLPLILMALSPDTTRDVRVPIAALHAVRALCLVLCPPPTAAAAAVEASEAAMAAEAPCAALFYACLEAGVAAVDSSKGPHPLYIPREEEPFPAFHPHPTPLYAPTATLELFMAHLKCTLTGIKEAAPGRVHRLVEELRVGAKGVKDCEGVVKVLDLMQG